LWRVHEETNSRRDTHPFALDDGVLAGRYELGAVLGRGAKGVVFRGRDRVLRREVAIKVLDRDGTDDDQASERWRQEARLGARISHPNAVAIFDTGVHDGQPFIVMECLSGETLATRIAERRLSPSQVRDIGVQLLSALDAAHRRGIIHRDIKPANLLFTATGSVKVADFGIATTADGDPGTDTRRVVGTLAYLAPERLQGAAATPQSDIYAAGVVLYEALTGRKPFDADTPASMLDQISSGSSGNLAALRPDAGATLTRVVTRALQADPTARYATASAMARALEKARFARPRSSLLPPPPPVTVAAPPPLPPPLPPPVMARSRRGRSVAFASIALLAAASGAGAFVVARDRGPGDPSQTESPSSSAPAVSAASAPLVSTTLVSSTTVAPTTTVATTTVSTTTVSSTTRPTTTTVRSTTTRATTTTRPATTTATTRNSRGRGRGQND
jgi:serine/threonine protein kinase